MYLPFAATNFYTAQRKTHVQYLTQLDYEMRVESGMYRDVDLTPAGKSLSARLPTWPTTRSRDATTPATTKTGCALCSSATSSPTLRARATRRTSSRSTRRSSKVLAIYRNWDEEDDSREPLDWFVEFPFIPWRGAYPIGLPHMIGGLSAAATGALRALMDSAHIQNVPTMLKLKGGTAAASR
jgi:hypothetical protein